MKKIILCALFSTGVYSQTATVHFFYGSNELLGAEVMVQLGEGTNKYLGGGFSGATNLQKAKGRYSPGDATEWDKKFFNERVYEQWCSVYAVGSLGYFKSLLIKGKMGLGVYYQIDNFKGVNPSSLQPYDYNKRTGMKYLPTAGLSAMYAFCDNYGVEFGADYFNGATFGFTVIF